MIPLRISHAKKFIFFALPRTGSTSFRDALDPFSDIKSRHITEVDESFPFYHHITPKEVKKIFKSNGWDWTSYKKFCVVRNPYDRAVSLYHHYLKIKAKNLNKDLLRSFRDFVLPDPSFDSFVRRMKPDYGLEISLEKFICNDSGDKLVDDIIRFENIASDGSKYLANYDIFLNDSCFPRLNASNSRKKYEAYYNSKTRNIIEKKYYDDIHNYGYSF